MKTTLVDRQYFNLEEFLDGLKLVVVMVAHDEVRQNAEKLKKFLVFDTRNCMRGENVVKL